MRTILVKIMDFPLLPCYVLSQAIFHVALGYNKILNLTIEKQWNGDDINHRPIDILLSGSDGDFLSAQFSGRFFHDPAPPTGTPGEPYPELWKYEVAEIFFLAPNNQYLEVEVSPYGKHLLILLNGTRNPIKDMLPMKYEANISRASMTWIGQAEIPLSYLPHGVSKLNAFAIHGSGKDRYYEALYPVPAGKYDKPDFHRLEYFKEFAITDLVKNMSLIGTYWDSLGETPSPGDAAEPSLLAHPDPELN